MGNLIFCELRVFFYIFSLATYWSVKMEEIKMLPEDLKEDEIEHELLIRNLSNLLSRRDRTAGLRSRLKKETEGLDLSPVFRQDILNGSLEFRTCESKIDELNEALNTAHVAKDYGSFMSAVSRVKHLYDRLSRLVDAYPDQSNILEAKQSVFDTLENITKVDLTSLKAFRSHVGPKTPKPLVSVEVESDLLGAVGPSIPRPVSDEIIDFNLQGADVCYELNKKSGSLQSNKKSQRVSTPPIHERLTSKPKPDKYDELARKVDLLTESLSKLLSHSNYMDTLQLRGKRSGTENLPRHEFQSPSQSSYDQFTNNLNSRPMPHGSRRYEQDRVDRILRPAEIREEIFEDERNQRPRVVRPIPPNRFNKKSIPVNQWNVKFSGDESGLSLSEFLGEIELFANSERLSREDLFDSAVHLFSGPARKWFKAHYLEFTSWNELVVDLKLEFQPEYYDYMLLSEIDSRVQGKEETFCSFLAEMQILFGKLGIPLGENHKLYILRKNMQSSYAVAMSTIEINTVRQLATICKRIDSTKLMQIKQGMPSNPQGRFLEPAFRTPLSFKKYQSVNMIDEEAELDENLVDAMKFNNQGDRGQAKVLKCYKCEALGHMHRDCKVPQSFYFCYTCGLKNVTVSNCPSCNKSRNLKE